MTYGGKRPNAGRKLGSGRYGEPTKALRIPLSRIEEILALIKPEAEKTDEEKAAASYIRPLYRSSGPCAHGSHMSEPVETLNLNDYLLSPHPETMFFVQVTDMAMAGAGIYEGNLVLADSRVRMHTGDVVVAVVNDSVLIRRLRYKGKKPYLVSGNLLYPALVPERAEDIRFLGVVTAVVRRV